MDVTQTYVKPKQDKTVFAIRTTRSFLARVNELTLWGLLSQEGVNPPSLCLAALVIYSSLL